MRTWLKNTAIDIPKRNPISSELGFLRAALTTTLLLRRLQATRAVPLREKPEEVEAEEEEEEDDTETASLNSLFLAFFLLLPTGFAATAVIALTLSSVLDRTAETRGCWEGGGEEEGEAVSIEWWEIGNGAQRSTERDLK